MPTDGITDMNQQGDAGFESEKSPEAPNVKKRRKTLIFAGLGVVAIVVLVIGWIVANQVPLEKATLRQAFSEDLQKQYLPTCDELSSSVEASQDFVTLAALGDEAASKTENDDTVAFLLAKGLSGGSTFASNYEGTVATATLPSLQKMISAEKEDFQISEKQLSGWSESWVKTALSSCDLGDEYRSNLENLARTDSAIADVMELATAQEALGQEVKQAFPGYPRIVSLGSINSKVAVWIQRESPATELVALAPGVYTPFNPSTPNLSSYYNDWAALYGDCGVIHQFFSPMSYSCGPGILPGVEE